MNDLTTEKLLQVYRHANAASSIIAELDKLLPHLFALKNITEKELLVRQALPCRRCQRKHDVKVACTASASVDVFVAYVSS